MKYQDGVFYLSQSMGSTESVDHHHSPMSLKWMVGVGFSMAERDKGKDAAVPVGDKTTTPERTTPTPFTTTIATVIYRTGNIHPLHIPR